MDSTSLSSLRNRTRRWILLNPRIRQCASRVPCYLLVYACGNGWPKYGGYSRCCSTLSSVLYNLPSSKSSPFCSVSRATGFQSLYHIVTNGIDAVFSLYCSRICLAIASDVVEPRVILGRRASGTTLGQPAEVRRSVILDRWGPY